MGASLGIVGSVLGIGSSLIGAAGAAQQSAASEEAFKYRAAIARRNKEIAGIAAAEARSRGEIQATDAIARGIQSESQQRSRVSRLIGEQRVALGASGVSVDAGTAGDIQADTAALGELDALTIRANTEREVRALRLASADTAAQFEQQALASADEAALAERGATAAGTAGIFNVGATLLSGASSVAGKWYQYNQAGG
jgi:hypothetical protein